jgi:hypothetical protein
MIIKRRVSMPSQTRLVLVPMRVFPCIVGEGIGRNLRFIIAHSFLDCFY